MLLWTKVKKAQINLCHFKYKCNNKNVFISPMKNN